MRIWAIGDPHLSFHEDVNKPMDVFGFGWENHAQHLKDAWIESIAEDDVVIIPGDISWGLKLEEALPDIEWIHSLPGIKLITKGNHDLWWSRIHYLNSLFEDVHFMQNDAYYIEELNAVICGTRGWPYPGSAEYSQHDEKIYRRELLRLEMGLESAKAEMKKNNAFDAEVIVALHYPPCDAHCRETEFTKLLEKYEVDQCVYGHLHGPVAYRSGPKGVFRGVDYKLVSMDYLGAKPKLIYDKDEVAEENE